MTDDSRGMAVRREVLVYAGVPAANSAFAVAQPILAEVAGRQP